MRLFWFWSALVFLAGPVIVLQAQETPSQEQEEDDEEGRIPIESDWSALSTRYSRGDQTFSISLGLVKPLFYADQEAGYLPSNMNLGGSGSLGWNYFLGTRLFVGGELSGMFASTLGENMYYIVPMGFRVGFQPTVRRFEFPLSVLVGIAPQSHRRLSYFGFFAKSTAGIFFRFHTDWSLGLNTSFWWVPQWTGKRREEHDRPVRIHGFFLEFAIGVRYHF
ncbi:MAG: hypothetical protein LBG84_10830 [Treponema sp.]|jgi:hypothetical protein|nr:hypothetical protein [Treponema sp.]